MEWMFANRKNLELAFNRDVPYSLDPRKPAAKAKITEIWTEAIDALQPKAIHFGLDEVDMRGFPDDPNLVSQLWKDQVGYLLDFAAKKSLPAMLWGDKMLAPGEAPDATHGDTKQHALDRRSLLKPGNIVTTWHYRNSADPQLFRPVLKLWKDAGMVPIAAHWYRPENIQGMVRAAAAEGCGVLNTTWAGYESSETTMRQALIQYSAFALAAHFAWNESPFPGEPSELMRRLYFENPAPSTPQSGITFGNGPWIQHDRYRYKLITGASLRSAISPDQQNRPDEILLPLKGTAKSIHLALRLAAPYAEKAEVAELILETADGKQIVRAVREGLDVRATQDPASTWTTPRQKSGRTRGASLIEWDLGQSVQLKSLRIRSKNVVSGLSILGLNTLDP
jgi:hypothetical protein